VVTHDDDDTYDKVYDGAHERVGEAVLHGVV